MAKVIFKQYLWLIDKLSQRPMKFEEICSSYERSTLFEPRHPLRVRTLYNWREKINDLFGIDIVCDNHNFYRIEHRERLNDNSPARWIIQTMAVNEMVADKAELRPRILLEKIPSGKTFLMPILEAMKQGRTINFVYRKFGHTTDEEPIEMQPFCVKVSQRRWYVLGNVLSEHARKNVKVHPLNARYGVLKIYALDRIQSLDITENSWVYPEDFSADDFFNRLYGVYIAPDCPIEQVKLRISAAQRDYVRSLPMHITQAELETTDEYSVFGFYLPPSIDFTILCRMQ